MIDHEVNANFKAFLKKKNVKITHLGDFLKSSYQHYVRSKITTVYFQFVYHFRSEFAVRGSLT